MKDYNLIVLLLVLLVVFDGFTWWQVIFNGPNKNLELYFLDIGQGDSELVMFPGGVKVLIDGGPDSKILDELGSIFRSTDRYIDLVVMSHPQTDHFNGFIDVLKRYKVGAFISSGKSGPAKSFNDLVRVIQENQINTAVLGEGDKIKYGDNVFDILSPSPDLLQSEEPNDWTLVMKFSSSGAKALFTGDIDAKVEDKIVGKYDVGIDILKVAHHGSKFSSSLDFLKSALPKIAVIEVGAHNTYGHPTPQTLQGLADISSKIFRTDKDGTIKLEIADAKINIFKEK